MPSLKRNELKKLAAEKFLDEVKTALADAHLSAAAAFADYIQQFPEHPLGVFDGSAGDAVVLVVRPSYRLRTALKQLGEIEQWPAHRGWSVSDFGSCSSDSRPKPLGTSHGVQGRRQASSGTLS